MSGRTWEVGIVGTFDVENYGDLLFPLLAEAELRERLGSVNVRPFSYRRKSPPEWPYAVTSIDELPDIVGDLDALLIGGGYLIRFDKEVAAGYGPTSAHIHHPTGYWLTPALMALDRGIPVLWNAPGMHCNEIPRWAVPLLTLALEQSAYVAVRDEASKATLSRLVSGERIAAVPDTGFGIAKLLGGGPVRETPYIVVQPARWLPQFPKFVKTHASRLADFELLALPLGPVLGETPEMLAKFLPRFTRLPHWPAPLALAQIISNAAAVVGHSYHLAITALASGVPVFTSVDLDAGKFTALRGLVHPLSALRASDPDWFFSRLGKTAPSPAVRALEQKVAAHWDHIGAAIMKGRSAASPAFGRFWQTLPALLEREPVTRFFRNF